MPHSRAPAQVKTLHHLFILPATNLAVQHSSPTKLEQTSHGSPNPTMFGLAPEVLIQTSPCLQRPSFSFPLGCAPVPCCGLEFSSPIPALALLAALLIWASHLAFSKSKLGFYKLCSFCSRSYLTANKSLEGRACSGQARDNNWLMIMKGEPAVDNETGRGILVIGGCVTNSDKT